MAVFKRGNVWWYKFMFDGVEYRESTKIKGDNPTKALEAERRHRNRLENGHNEIKDKSKSKCTFADAAMKFMDDQLDWSEKTRIIHSNSFDNHLETFFGKMALKQITAETIRDYQKKRHKEKNATGRTINIEVSLVRLVLKEHKMWSALADEVKMLKENKDVGRELTEDEQDRLLAAANASASRSLYPAILVSIHTGLRNEELRLLRWKQIDLINGTIQVGKSKTEGGEGRIVPLSDDAWQTLKDWRSSFPEALPDHAVWPREEYGLIGQKGTFGGTVKPYKTYPEQPIGSWKSAWQQAKKVAGIECRWHDLRHSFVSRVAASGATDQTIQQMAGWMSRKMIDRYSHVRAEAKRTAIAAAFNKPNAVQ